MKKKKSPARPKKKLSTKRKLITTVFSKRDASKKETKAPTKQGEAEARKAHDLYWKSYIVGDTDTLASLLDAHYTQIGSVENEVFFNKKDAVKFVVNTIDQVAGNVEMRNRKTKAVPVNGFILINEQCDLYVLIEGVWTFYSKFRATSLMQKTDGGWKIVHQHSSVPDLKAQEGENIAIEKISAENLQLRDAVKRRTVELEQKNRELAIEAAMEKVRARSLAMQKPEELAQVAEVLRNEMGALGVEELETSSIYMVDEIKATTECWYAIKDVRDKNKKLVTDHMTLALDETWVGREMQKFHHSKQTRTSILMRGKNRKEWINYCAGKSSVLQGYYGGEIPERTYHLLKFSNGFMGAASPGEISPGSWDLLQRATAVFSFAYKRFSDLQKAEAQARESQIQLALERVRARTMAMHKSEELAELSFELVKQVQALGVATWHCAFNIYDEDQNSSTEWGSNAGGTYPRYKTPREGIFLRYHQIGQTGETLHIEVIGEDKCADHYAYLCTLPGVGEQLIKLRDSGVSFPTSQIDYVVYFKYGYLLFITYESVPEAHDIFKRFAKVFEQTYTRFLDLQKAEAQAREAQIEAALERVRSRSMAMHSSHEMSAVISVVMEQFHQLGFIVDLANFNFPGRARDWTMWLARPGYAYPELIRLPYLDHVLFNNPREAVKKNLDFLADVLTREEGQRAMEHFFVHSEVGNDLPEVKARIKEARGLARSMVFGKHIALTISNYEGAPYTVEQNAILRRFHGVFEQSYTRFLDLQKAEAQAREAQIELGLERVRAKAMAMQKSDQLKELIGTVFTELTKLDLVLTRCMIMIFDPKTNGSTWWMANSEAPSEPIGLFVKHHELPVYLAYIDAWKERNLKFQYILEGKIKREWDDFLFVETDLSRLPGFVIEGMKAPNRVYLIASFNSFGNLTLAGLEPLSDAHFDIMLRFAKVFDLTYTRFNDLQRAEAQAREAQIEASLERVRAKTMAMQKSDELPQAANLLFQQVQSLGMPAWSAGYCIWDEDKQGITLWMSSEGVMQQAFHAPLTEDPSFIHMREAYERNEALHVEEVGGEALVTHYKYMRTLPVVGEILDSIIAAGHPLPTFQIFHCVYFSQGFLLFITYEPVPHAHDVFKRFGKVFDQTYTRFLDLQKAEEQARESQIQLALERVRARTMAMQKSEELAETATVLFEQFNALGEKPERIVIEIVNEKENVFEIWATKHGGSQLDQMNKISLDEPHVMKKMFQAWRSKIKSITIDLQGTELEEYFQTLKALGLPVNREIFGTRRVQYVSTFSKGILTLITTEPRPAESLELLERFAQVFDGTYTRFLDLQKAEAQAREAQIEAALERVRSRSMAMHKSEEFPEVIQLVFEQLRQLNFNIDSAQFDLNFRESDDIKLWTAVPGQPYPTQQHIPYFNNAVFNSVKHAKEAGLTLSAHNFTFEEKNEFFNYFFKHTSIPEERRKFILSSPGWARSVVYLDRIYLGIQNYSGIPYSDAEHTILGRFAKVFDQTYTRFLDLQKAEANAREATIEAALEKVRGKAMAMHNSNDLIATAGVLFAEMRKLGINTFRCGVGLLTKQNRNVRLYSATTTNETDNLPVVGSALLDGHEVLAGAYDAWLHNTDYFPVLKGELLKTYYEKINSTFTVPLEQTEQYEQHGFFLPFSEGLFYGYAEKPYTESEIKILHRFKAIVDLTFRRYMELQKSEEIAREAVRSASLDRVRAEIASMRTKQDLERITPLIWKELTTLGIPFVRCGVFIMDEQEELIHTFLSTPDGKAIAAFHVPYGSTPLAGSIEFWREKKMYITHWGLKEYAEFADAFIDKNEIEKRAHYLSSVPKDGIHLHLLPFMQGMLYVGNTASLTEDNLHLVQSVADAFSTAYARYEDFNKIESAKAQVEKTLSDLKQTQVQLVQSEKMASLGELTAGIAHEIQNPLNFVNNFSEVSKELLDEMKEELDKGNPEEAKALAADIIQNLEKINFHGKRADGIVKSMLQHSRKSNNQKELTDINALCDEYLRLSYHGLRAKDKSFNAKFEMDFDTSLPKINVVPQDIGRVVLNLINNAFYAVTERLRQAQPDSNYAPTVTVCTKKLNDKIEISVKDNGTGIPAKVKEKIFQPFFTTKPTGQGTGLGLSLSYDIVKAHGGELRVATKENEGSAFIISLPVV